MIAEILNKIRRPRLVKKLENIRDIATERTKEYEILLGTIRVLGDQLNHAIRDEDSARATALWEEMKPLLAQRKEAIRAQQRLKVRLSKTVSKIQQQEER